MLLILLLDVQWIGGSRTTPISLEDQKRLIMGDKIITTADESLCLILSLSHGIINPFITEIP